MINIVNRHGTKHWNDDRVCACKKDILKAYGQLDKPGNISIAGFISCGTPNGNRTHDSAVRGLRLNRLTMRAHI